MRIDKKEDSIYTKELDEMEKYFLNMFKRFIENDNDFLEKSVESIITEAVRRAKKEINLINKNRINTCTNSTRPKSPLKGEGPYFDTDLQKPIWYDGKNWVDAIGHVV